MPVLKIKKDGVWEEISGSSSSIELDTELSQEGMAADAKAVGDAIDNLAVQIEDAGSVDIDLYGNGSNIGQVPLINAHLLNGKSERLLSVANADKLGGISANEYIKKNEAIEHTNFCVVNGTTEPEDPTQNMIWIDTDVPIGRVFFGNNEPNEILMDGDIWIYTGKSSSVAFNSIRVGYVYMNMIYPLNANQYINNEWINKFAKSYQNGEWVDWGRLPREYQEVEYIQTTGTQWIDTGIIPDENTYQVSTKVISTSADNNMAVLGTSTNLYYHLTAFNNKWWAGQNGSDGGYGSYTPTVGAEYEIEFNNATNAIVINGAVLCSGKTYNSTASIKMAARGGDSPVYGNFKYYYFKVLNNQNGQVLMDLIPCYRRSDSVAGMYDLVSETFFTNAGTGTFIVGGDIT